MDSSGFAFGGHLWNGKTQIRYCRNAAIGFCVCIPNGKMDVQLYLGRESFVHDLYGRCIFWTELPKRPKAYFKLMGRNE